MNRRNFLKSTALAGAGALAGTGVAALDADAADRTRDTKSIRNFNPNMRYRTFGKTGDKVSVLGFGTMRLPIIGNDMSKIDIPAAMRLVTHALDNGLNYIDTSWPYHGDIYKGGSSEPFVGEVVKTVGREKMYIATKLPIWAVNSRADMDKFLNAQLKRLNTDYVDYYLVHSIRQQVWDRMVSYNLSDFLDKAVQSGRVRHVGFSPHDIPETYRQIMDYYDWSFNQHVCNYYDINFQAGMRGIRQSALRDMGFVAMEPLMGGMLADQLPPEALEVLNATGIKRSPASWAFRWVWDQPEVTVAISGMNRMDHLNENLRQAQESDVPMSAEETAAIDKVREILKSKGTIKCIECGKCSCHKGIGIQMCFEMYNAHDTFKVPPVSHHQYKGSVKTEGPIRGAENCDACGQCKPMCPVGLDIPAELKKVAARFA